MTPSLHSPGPGQSQRQSNRTQNKLLTLAFQYLRRRHLMMFMKLRREAERSLPQAKRNDRLPLRRGAGPCVICGRGQLPAKKKLCADCLRERRTRATQVSERHHRLCVHYLADNEERVLAGLRREAEKYAVQARNGGRRG